MKIVLCTTPIRPVPTDFPPFGSMALIQALRTAGFDPIFYDIDCFRPDFDEVVRYFESQKPDLIGISAVVSTAYGYTKKLCLALKQRLPGTPIVVGGNLAASAEILHRFCKVDVCGIGEGERVIVNLASAFQEKGGLPERNVLRGIKGLTFLEKNGELTFTGYEMPLAADEFPDPDFSILERFSRIEHFVGDPFSRPEFARDPRSYQPHRRGQKMSTVLASKGCVARCTFCHRWDKGYRAYPAEVVVRRMKYLKERYNVGFFCFTDENFGSDKKQRDELIKLIKPMDVLYEVGGVRCRTVDQDLLRRMKESGCTAVYYGMETGSPKILEVMEKNASLEINYNAAKWTREAGLYTVFQMVLGMPGEDAQTIRETSEFVQNITAPLPEPPHRNISCNYIQALPGTPVYEYAREKGLIQKTLEREEEYLLQVSDINASDDSKFVNFTSDDYLTVQSWRRKILLEAEANWYRQRQWKAPAYHLPNGKEVVDDDCYDYYTKGGYFNLRRMVHSPLMFRYFWFLRHPYIAASVIYGLRRQPPKLIFKYLFQYFRNKLWRMPGLSTAKSVRRIVNDMAAPPVSIGDQNMLPLRRGR